MIKITECHLDQLGCDGCVELTESSKRRYPFPEEKEALMKQRAAAETSRVGRSVIDANIANSHHAGHTAYRELQLVSVGQNMK